MKEEVVKINKKIRKNLYGFLMIIFVSGIFAFYMVLTYKNDIIRTCARVLINIFMIEVIIFIISLILYLILYFKYKKKTDNFKIFNNILKPLKIIVRLFLILLGSFALFFTLSEISNYITQKNIVKNNDIVVDFTGGCFMAPCHNTYLINQGESKESNIEITLKSDYEIISIDSCEKCQFKENENVIYSISNDKRQFYVVSVDDYSDYHLLYEYFEDNNELKLITDKFPNDYDLKYFYAK